MVSFVQEFLKFNLSELLQANFSDDELQYRKCQPCVLTAGYWGNRILHKTFKAMKAGIFAFDMGTS